MVLGVDPAIVEALRLDPSKTDIKPHGGSGFASSYKLTTLVEGRPTRFFVKTGPGNEAEVMFKGEHESLNAIHNAVPNFCPKSHAHGQLTSARGQHFMATDFLDLGVTKPAGSGLSLAAKLAKLHNTPAPIPEGFDAPMYGFPVTTCCGSTPQSNEWKRSWADFYAENRLRGVWRACVMNNGQDAELSTAVDKIATRVVPRLIGDGHVKGLKPVVVHGDLWSGNHSRGQIAGRGGAEEVVFDPFSVYGHSEYDLGIMRMFGGFGSSFWSEYHKLVPKAEPVEEFEDRLKLYELYHHLNHFAIFGGSYRHGAKGIMRELISKYGQL